MAACYHYRLRNFVRIHFHGIIIQGVTVVLLFYLKICTSIRLSEHLGTRGREEHVGMS